MEPISGPLTASKKLPRAVADGANGIIIAVADIAGSPESVFHALTTNEVEHWWRWPDLYSQKDWKADVSVCGAWSVTVELFDGNWFTSGVSSARLTSPIKSL